MPPSFIPENRSARVNMMLRANKNISTKKLNRGEGSRNLLGKTRSNAKSIINKNNIVHKNNGIPFSLLYGSMPTKANSIAINAVFANPKTRKIKRNNINRITRMVAHTLA